MTSLAFINCNLVSKNACLAPPDLKGEALDVKTVSTCLYSRKGVAHNVKMVIGMHVSRGLSSCSILKHSCRYHCQEFLQDIHVYIVCMHLFTYMYVCVRIMGCDRVLTLGGLDQISADSVIL